MFKYKKKVKLSMKHISKIRTKVNNLQDLVHRGSSEKLNMLSHPKATHSQWLSSTKREGKYFAQWVIKTNTHTHTIIDWLVLKGKESPLRMDFQSKHYTHTHIKWLDSTKEKEIPLRMVFKINPTANDWVVQKKRRKTPLRRDF